MRTVVSWTTGALLVALLPVLSVPSQAAAFEIPGDVDGHQHVQELLDVSHHQCGTVVRGVEDTGYMTSATTYGYVMRSPQGVAAGNAIDHSFVQDQGGSSLADAVVWELPAPAATVDLFPSIDHGPVPGEALESTVYGFDDLSAPPSTWEIGDISTIFDKGWSDWISDDYTSRWEFTAPHKYYAARWGGPKAMVADGDYELDAICAPQLVPTGLEAGPDQTVNEGDAVTLSAHLVGGSAALGTYQWSVESASGPPVTLSAPGSATTSFHPLDDGVYTFSVKATVGDKTFDDDVKVTVGNRAPEISAEAKPTADDKLALVTTTLTDPGALDTHVARYDWGDGTAPQTFPVLQGSGWGYANAGHVYAALGHYTVSVTVTDDDGAASNAVATTVDVGGAGPAAPKVLPSLWAASETLKNAIDLTGATTVTDGLVHSNNDIRVTGNGKRLTGGVEHHSGITVSGTDNVIDPAATKVPVAAFPVEWVLDDYRPGGIVQRRLGSAYVDDSSKCTPSGWQPSEPLSDGVHWVPCDVRIRDGVLDGRKVTLVATGGIDVVTTDDRLDAYDAGLQFLTGSGSKKAIKVTGTGTSIAGTAFAPAGGIEVSGSTHRFECGLLGQNVSISGDGNTFASSACTYDTDPKHTIPVAAPPILVPTLRAGIDGTPDATAPGGTIDYTGRLSNKGSLLAVPVLFGATALTGTPTSVDAGSASVERFDEASQTWVTLGSTGDRVTLDARPIDSDGAHYAETVAGSTIDGSALAAWAGVAQIDLTPAELEQILDPVVTSALRVKVQLTTSGGRARTFTRAADNLIDTVRQNGGLASDGELSAIPAAGDTHTFDRTDLPALAALHPGESAAFDLSRTLPRPAARRDGETSADYLTRLRALDGRDLVGADYGQARTAIGTVLAPQVITRGHQRLGLVDVEVVAPSASTLGKDVTLDVKVTNSGSAAADDLAVQLSADGLGPIAVTGLPATLAPGAEAVGHATVQPVEAGSLSASATATWTSPGSPVRFGPTDDTAEFRVNAATDHPVTLGSVSGRFFHSAADASTFTATPADTPVFSQSFPTVAFNPPAGVLPGDPGADPSSRPFTDVLVGPDAMPAGTLAAAVKDHAAGTGDLASFQAVFSGVLDVTKAGPVTLSVISDDGFTLGVEGATRISGPMDGAPTSTPFDGLPVVGAHNSAGALGTYPVTFDLPAAGRYRFELDYFTRSGDSMSLVLTHAGAPGAAGGGRVFLTGHDPDYHAVGGPNTTGARHMIQQAVGYVTGQKPAPRLLLVTDLRNPGSAYIDPRLGMKASGFTTFDVADYGSGTAGVLDLHTVDFAAYDAVVVASDHGGWLRQDELDVLNARKGDVDAYLSAGGGLVAFAEGSPQSGLTTHDRMAFTGCPPVGLDEQEVGFTITPQGLTIGLNQSDLNGNFTHNAFANACGLDVLDTDLSGHIISLATPGTVAGPTRVVPPSNYLVLTPIEPRAEVGSTVALEVHAMDAAGDARPNAAITLDLSSGSSEGSSYNQVTDASGVARFPLSSTVAREDHAFATALLAGDPAVSNSAHITWTTPTVDGGDAGGGGSSTPGTGAAVSGLEPAEGTAVTEPTPVTIASVSPQPDTTIVGWKLTARQQGDPGDTARTLGSGDSTPPSASATSPLGAFSLTSVVAPPLAVFDPTVVPNGVWILRLVVVDSAGGRSVTEVAVVVDGHLKLGDAEVSYEDMAVHLAGIPISVQRRYRSIDRYDDKGLGHGWSLETASFRVQVNGRLGDGGWEEYGCGTGLIFVPLCFQAHQRHFVTVTWPDGHTETFDLTPGTGSTFFPGIVPIAYTGRGTRSRLEPGPNDTAGWYQNGSIYGGAFGSDGLYDPQQFQLIGPDGTRYLLDRKAGLLKATDRHGNTLTFTKDGVASSQGPGLTYHRDAAGRIDRIDGPDLLTVGYGYDAAGDLRTVNDANDHAHAYGYEQHLLTSVDEPGAGPFQVLKYDDQGRLVSYSDGVNGEQTVASEVGSRTETTVSPDHQETVVTSYDERGNAIAVDRIFDGQHHRSTYSYNEFDQMTLRRDPTDREWRATYDDRGNLRELTDNRAKTTRFDDYTDFGMPRTIVDELGHATTLTFDPDTADLRSIEDPTHRTRSWTYFGDGSVKTYRDGSTKADGSPREWAYTYRNGAVATETDPAGKVTSYEHDDAGRLTAATDPTNVRTGYRYDPVGNLRFVDLPLGRSTEYRYDERDHLTDIFDGEGRHTAFTYNDLGQLWKETNGAGDTTTYTYTPRYAVKTKSDKLGHQTTYDYDGGGRLTGVTDGENRTTGYGYDLADRITSITRPDHHTEAREYDPNGRLRLIRDTLGGETILGRDDTGRITSVDDPVHHPTGYGYDAAGRLTRVTDALQHATGYEYDGAGRPTVERNPLDETTTYAYGPAGHLAGVTDGEQRTTTFGYDDSGRPTRQTDPLGRASVLGYDAGGWPQTFASAAGVSSTIAWDKSGLLASITDQLGHSVSWGYDGAGRLDRRTDARNHPTTWAYDDAGRIASQTDVQGGVTRFGHDGADQLTSITDARNKTSTIGYDPLGNMASFTDPLHRTRTWTYDELGRLDTTRDAKNQVTDWSYDAASRPDKVTTPSGTIDFTFDDADRLASVSDPTGTVNIGYDDADRPRRVDSPGGLLTYGYDHSGLQTRLGLPQGDVTRTYDGAGQLDKVTDWNGAWLDYDVNGDARPTRTTRSNGVTTDRHYDPAGHLDQVSHTGPGGLIDRFAYTLDPNGNRTGETSNAGTTTYVFDDLDRLRHATYPGGRDVAYTYNPDGSRKTRTVNGDTTTYSYDDAGELTSETGPAGAKDYGYDANGNRTSAGSDTFGYDWANRMTSATVGGVDHAWTYDGLGQRVESDGVPQLWDRFADTTDGVPELVGAGGTAYLHDPFGGLASTITGASSTFALGDALGSTRATVDAGGTVTGTAAYDAFGTAIGGTGAQSPFGFAGEQTDPGGMVFLRARTMDTDTGGFMQADTTIPGAPGAVGFNRYAYAGDNPTTWIDPSGHDSAMEYGSLVESIAARLVSVGRFLGRCAYGAFSEAAQGLVMSALTGGATVASVATDAVLGCVTEGAGKTAPELPEGYPSFSAAKRGMGSPGPDNVFDHVVEQSQIRRSGFAPEDVHNPFNMNPVSARTNQIKANYYSSKQPFTGGVTVRDWLTGQSFADQYSFGMDVLTQIRKGIIK